MKSARHYSLRFALPLHYIVTLGVALLILWGLVTLYGRTQTVMIGWVVGFLIATRVVRWIVNRRRPARRDPE